jgi:hypothetical protein
LDFQLNLAHGDRESKTSRLQIALLKIGRAKCRFSRINLGSLSHGGLLEQARGNSWGHLIFKNWVELD